MYLLTMSMQSDATTMKISVAFPQKSGKGSTIRPSYTTPGNKFKGFCTLEQSYLYIYVHCEQPYCPSIYDWIKEKCYKNTISIDSALNKRILRCFQAI